MPAPDPQDRERAPGPPPDVGAVEGTAYGSGRWGGTADSRSGYSSPASAGQPPPGSATPPCASDLEGGTTAVPPVSNTRVLADTPKTPPSPSFPTP